MTTVSTLAAESASCQCPQCRLMDAIEASGDPVFTANSSDPDVFETPAFQLSGAYVAAILVTGPESRDVAATLLGLFGGNGKYGFSVGQVDSLAGDGVGDLLYIGFCPRDLDIEMFTNAIRGALVKVLDNLDLLAKVTMDLYPIESIRLATSVRKVIQPSTFVFDRSDEGDELTVVVLH